jgi:hypothetical protein
VAFKLSWPALAILLAACGTLDLPSGQIECGPGGSCPRGMTCGADGLCYAGATTDAGGDAAVPCPGGRLQDFTDDFDDLDAWNLVGTEIESCFVAVSGGVLTIATSESGTCGIQSVELYDFIDQSAFLRLTDDNVNPGNPDFVFRAVIAGATLQLVLFDGEMTAMNCPDSGGCGTAGIPGGSRQWWRLRHDPVQSAVMAELSSTGLGYPDGVPLDVSDDDPTCVRIFIGTTGQLSGDALYPTWIDRFNIF